MALAVRSPALLLGLLPTLSSVGAWHSPSTSFSASLWPREACVDGGDGENHLLTDAIASEI